MRFIALIEKGDEGYGAWFPQLPGCVAMGRAMDDVVRNVTTALAEWIADEADEGRFYEPEDFETTVAREDVRFAIGEGAVPAFITLVQETGRPVRANLSLDAGLLSAIDDAARERGMTRSSWLASAAKRALVLGQ